MLLGMKLSGERRFSKMSPEDTSISTFWEGRAWIVVEQEGAKTVSGVPDRVDISGGEFAYVRVKTEEGDYVWRNKIAGPIVLSELPWKSKIPA